MKKIIATILIAVVCFVSAFAQDSPVADAADDSGKEIQPSLSTLLPVLKQSYVDALGSDSLLVDYDSRRQDIQEMVRSADEVAIMMYTQSPGFAIDMALALEKVSSVYNSFQEHARLSDRYLATSRSGLRRYTLLGETLRSMRNGMSASMATDSLMVADSILLDTTPSEPLVEEDSEEKALLDSCLHYTDALAALYGRSVQLAVQDSIVFADTEHRLQQAYDYAQTNYADTQKNIFIGGKSSIFHILRNWDAFLEGVKVDMQMRFRPEIDAEGHEGEAFYLSGRTIIKYGLLSLLALLFSFLLASIIIGVVFNSIRKERVKEFKPIISAILALFLFVIGILIVNLGSDSPYWTIAYRLLSQFSWLTLAIFVSLLIRIRGSQARPSRNIYIPTLLLAFMNILLRAMFVPASIVPLIFPPALLLVIVWQSWMNVRYRKEVDRTDLRYMWASVLVMSVACILSLTGYSMVGVFLFTFWTYLLALLHTITAVYYLMRRYYENSLSTKKARYHEENPYLSLEDQDSFIEVTWLYDLISMVVIPIAILLSFPASVQLTSHAYQLSLTGANFLHQPIFHWEALNGFTPLNLLIIVALFFVFRYLIYLVKAMARIFKMRRVIEKRKSPSIPLKESDVNMSLPSTIISLLGWLIYLLIVFTILRVSTRAITTISTGLAAGVGFALKDLINNFFYGVQLMAGRIRVGDKISCDGIRGVVKRVSYQTTLVEEEDGSLIAFTNTDLFTKKFRNLNSGKNYELLKMPVSVRYGTDIEKAREVILEALKPLMTQDKSGRDIVDPSFPIDVRFDSFGDSSVNLIVALYSTVETHYTFPSRAKEAIYNAFYENGIEIPFNQHDIYIKHADGPSATAASATPTPSGK